MLRCISNTAVSTGNNLKRPRPEQLVKRIEEAVETKGKIKAKLNYDA